MRYSDLPVASKEMLRAASPALYAQQEALMDLASTAPVYVVVSVDSALRGEFRLDGIEGKTDAEIGKDVRMLAELLLRARLS